MPICKAAILRGRISLEGAQVVSSRNTKARPDRGWKLLGPLLWYGREELPCRGELCAGAPQKTSGRTGRMPKVGH